MFDSDAECDLMALYGTDLDLEAVFFDDTCTDEWVRAERELELVKACEEHIAYAHAMQSRALARFAKLRPGIEHNSRMSEFAVDEIALAARWSQGVAGQRLNLARSLTERLPGTLEALERGKIDLRRAQKIADLTDPLAPDLALQVEDAVLPKAAKQNPNALYRSARRVIARLDPDGVQKRRTERKKDRRVEFYPGDDAMAELRAVLPAEDAYRIHKTLDDYARDMPADDDRTMDQRRADILADLLLRRSDGRERTQTVVHVTMPADMLIGKDDEPAELPGYGPLPAEVARDIAAGGTWKRLLSDPISGHLLDYGRTTYRPPAGLADFVRARDQRCIFPGCHRPANTCDIDHRKEYPEGPTSARNLACLCRHHHRLKHQGGWKLDKQGDRYLWTTPTGRQYSYEPPPIAQPRQPKPAPKKPAAGAGAGAGADEPPPF